MKAPNTPSASQPSAVIKESSTGELWHFSGLQEVIQAGLPHEVLPGLKYISQAVEENGLYAAGFLSYEAATAFDPYFQVNRDHSGFPLMWFGLFSQVTRLDHPEPPKNADSVGDLRWDPSVDRESYARGLAAIKEHIRQGDTYQVNFTYRLRAKFNLDPWDVFCTLLDAQNPPYAAFIDTGDFALCSMSPELFFTLNQDLLHSRPMKGTASRGLWAEQDSEMAQSLRDSSKERAENVMIVDMVRNDMGRIARPGSVQVKKLFEVERYQDVWQMTSLVRAETEASLERIFQALFPPASITGAPKIKTMEIISALETTPRRIYTGTMGFIAPGRQAQFNVAIRTLLVDKVRSTAEYGIGGGIVWDSQTDSEMDESRVKARVLRTRREDFELLESILWDPEQGFPFLTYHLNRLRASARYFGFKLDIDSVHKELDRLVANLQRNQHKIRLLISPRGKVRVQAQELSPEIQGFSDLPLAGFPVDPDNKFLYHKTTQRSIYQKALDSRPGFKDVLLYNTREEVTESTIANLVVKKNGELLTPSVQCGLLPGVYRAWLLEKQEIREEILTIEDVLSSPEAYLLNAVRGMHRVQILP